MQILLVLAHPSTASFTHAVADRAARSLRSAGHEVHLLDLYALGVSAAMTADEHRAYATDTPLLDPLLRTHAALVAASEALVFVYPTWWSGLPAILKGWLERVMVPGVAFELGPDRRVRPLLGHLRHIVGISTYGSPRTYVRLIGDNGRRTLVRTLRLNAALRTRSHWMGLYAIDTSTAEERAGFLDAVDRRLAAL